MAWLAQREHSELELRRKLMRRLQDQAGADDGGADAGGMDPKAQVDGLVALLLERGYLNEQRFIASRLHVRAGRHGPLRIEQELARHGLALPSAEARELRLGEFDAATALWQRRFGAAPADARDAARQARFLAGRGYSADVVRRVLRQAATSPPPAEVGAVDPVDTSVPGRRRVREAPGQDDTSA